MKRAARRQAGFTLVELMVSLVIFSLVVGGVLSVAVTMTQGYREQRAAIVTEGAVRVPLDFLADAIRQASPAVSDPTLVVDAKTCETGAILVTNSSTGPDTLTVTYASGGVVTATRTNPVVVGTTSVVEVTDGSQFTIGDYVLITDLTAGHMFKVTNVNINVLTIDPGACTAVTYNPGALVIRAQRATFSIADLDGIPCLMMDPDGTGTEVAEPIAEGIEDMQIAVGIDADSAGGILEVPGASGDEWHYNNAGDATPTGAIRAVRITLIARALTALPSGPTFVRPAAEDRDVGTVGDLYRRRVLRSIVEVRNVGGSP